VISLLGDSFPPEYRINFCKRRLKKGAVLRTTVDFTNPPKIKRFLIVGLSKENESVGVIVFNSKINLNIHHAEALRYLQLKFKPDGKEYLDHASFLDCSIIYELKADTLLKKMVDDIGAVLGEMAEDDLIIVFERLKNAKTIPAKIKRKYGIVE